MLGGRKQHDAGTGRESKRISDAVTANYIPGSGTIGVIDMFRILFCPTTLLTPSQINQSIVDWTSWQGIG